METPHSDAPAKPFSTRDENSVATDANADANADANMQNFASPLASSMDAALVDASSETPLETPFETLSEVSPATLSETEKVLRVSPPPVQFQNVRVSLPPPAPPDMNRFAPPNSTPPTAFASTASASTVSSANAGFAVMNSASINASEVNTSVAGSSAASASLFAPIDARAAAPTVSLPPQVSPNMSPLLAPETAPLGASQTAFSQAPVSSVRPVALGVVNSFLLGGVLACGLVGLGYVLGRGSADRVLDVGGKGARETTVVAAVQAVGPAVMNVDTTFGGSKGTKEFLPSPGEMGKPQQGKGTGFVIDSKRGLMLTNAHVAAGAAKIQVTTREGKKYTGRVLGFDRKNDIAVVELANKSLPEAKLAPLKNTHDVQIGETAIAIGNPFGQANTVTVGVVSATGRTIPVPDSEHGGAFQLTEMLQTDAAINPGNSGGPLCNSKGEVIGINTAIFGIGTGLGFAIPINKARAVAERIIKKGPQPEPKKIGFETRAISKSDKEELGFADTKGALVQSVAPNSPPAKAGLQAGDIVRGVDGKPTVSPDALNSAISAKKTGETARVEILRNGAKQTLTWKIGK